jgi:hypothetical protein
MRCNVAESKGKKIAPTEVKIIPKALYVATGTHCGSRRPVKQPEAKYQCHCPDDEEKEE